MFAALELPTKSYQFPTTKYYDMLRLRDISTQEGFSFAVTPLASLFLHQDLVFLHYQEKIIAKRNKYKWLDTVYTPNPQDKMVVKFRQWLAIRAGGGIPWNPDCNSEISAEIAREKLFDVWTTHTQHCQVCQDALKNIDRLTVFSYIAAIICFGFGLFIDARFFAMKATTESLATSMFTTLPPWQFWVAIGSAIIFSITGYLLKKLSRLFYTYKFSHAHND
ncbi:MAG: hypothetical protein QNJ41_21085 [Xenococcaceae cyanobacterium MO_188.B32]|nr:hypothetical protein [Xenococcaceae cyanobacterium MO_188.B32]